MNDEQMKACREAFEKVMTDGYDFTREEGGMYVNSDTFEAYKGFQAAWELRQGDACSKHGTSWHGGCAECDRADVNAKMAKLRDGILAGAMRYRKTLCDCDDSQRCTPHEIVDGCIELITTAFAPVIGEGE